ncbi:MAG: VOC family protein [Solirubrobacterales bacterium]
MSSRSDPFRLVVPFLIVILCGAALLLIVLILGGSDIDKTSGKAIGTAAVFAAFSLTAMVGASLGSRRSELAPFGYLTAAFSLAAFLAVTSAIWSADLFSDSWKVAGDTIVLAVSAANVSLLLGSTREEDSEAVRLVRAGGIVALSTLSLMAIVEISSPGKDIGVQPMAIAAVLYVLGMILLPLLKRLSPPQPSFAAPIPAGAFTEEPRVLRLDHLVISVTDWDRANAFYRNILGAEVLSLPGGRIAYRIGGQQLNVHGPGAAVAPLAADPVRPGNSDLCFIWNGPLETAVEHLHRHGIEIIEGPVSRIGAQGPGQSVYFRDPDGSLIELISYLS